MITPHRNFASGVTTFICDLEADWDTQKAMDILDSVDLARYQSITHPQTQRQFLGGRYFLAEVLSIYFNLSIHTLRLGRGAYHKPFLTDYPDLFFNLSHAKRYLGIAVSTTGEVGIDIEMARPLPSFKLVSNRYFTLDDQTQLSTCPPEDQLTLFFKLWSQKEALAKGLGIGIFKGVNQVTPEGWMVQDISEGLPLGYFGGVAWGVPRTPRTPRGAIPPR